VNGTDPTGRAFIEDAQIAGLQAAMFMAYINTLGPAQRKLYAEAACVAITALWAVENPEASAADIVAYLNACFEGDE
jgi:hypothetical protein